MAPTPTDRTPLADLNGSSRAGLVTPSKPSIVNDGEVTWTISESSAKHMRTKLLEELPEQRKRAMAAEEKVASQEKVIAELQNTLASMQRSGGVKERKSLPKKNTFAAGEKTIEIASLRAELHHAEGLIEFKDSTIDRLIPKAVASTVREKEQIQSKEAEIEHLRRELQMARTEVAQLKAALEEKDAEIERIITEIVSLRSQGAHRLHSKDTEITEMRQELESAREELIDKRLELQTAQAKNLQLQKARNESLELQQARQELALKTEEIQQIRRELGGSRRESRRESQFGRGTSLELQQTHQDLDLTIAENDKLRRELDASRAECAQHLIELQRLRNGSQSRASSVGNGRSDNKDYEQDMLAMEEQQLSQRMMDLQRREQAVMRSEGFFVNSSIEPVVLPMRSPPASRPPTPRRIPAPSRARTPPVSPPRHQFNGGGGSGIPHTYSNGGLRF